MKRSGRAPHPAAWGVLFLPYGAAFGYVSVALAFVARERGLSDGTIAALIAAWVVPHTWKFFWAPVADTTFTRRGWHVTGNVVCGATLAAVGLAPLRAGSTLTLEILIALNGLSATFVGMATEGLLAHTIEPGERGRASGWLQAGNLGGAGIGGGVALAVATRIGLGAASVALGAVFLACSLPLLRIPEPAREGPRGGVGRELAGVGRDLWKVLASRAGILALALSLLPVGAGAASNLFAAVADRWATPSDAVALYTGVLAGGVSAVGCLAGGWLSDAIDRKVAYALTGLGLAATAAGMAVAPHTHPAFALFTLAYQFVGGVAYGTFTGFVLEVIGKGAAATKYNLLASLSNVPIYYMLRIEGWASDRFGATAMLLVDAGSEVAGSATFLVLALALLGLRRGTGPAAETRSGPST